MFRMRRIQSPKTHPNKGIKSANLRIAVFLFAIQVALSTRISILFPVRDYKVLLHGNEVNGPRKLRNAIHCFDCISHPGKSICIRGGGTDGAVFGTSLPSFFRDTVKPIARNARDRFQQRMEHRLEKQFREREKQLKRNKLWRESAESPQHSASPSSSYASSSQLESSRALKSSSYSEPKTAQNSLVLPSQLLKLGFLIIVVTEILDRTRFLDGGTIEIVWTRIVDFWKNDVLRACANIQSRIDTWYNEYAKRWISKVRDWLERRKEKILQRNIPRIWSISKVTLALSTVCGMVLSSSLSSWLRLLWRPVLVLAAVSETNHYCKLRGWKFVQILGETPHTLGIRLDTLLERYRTLLRNLILMMKGSEAENDCYYYEGYGSGKHKRGVLFESHADRTSLGLMGGDGCRSDHSRREANTRRNGSHFLSDAYSLGISGYHDNPKERKTLDMQLCSVKRWAIAKHGLLLGCAIGLALRGR